MQEVYINTQSCSDLSSVFRWIFFFVWLFYKHETFVSSHLVWHSYHSSMAFTQPCVASPDFSKAWVVHVSVVCLSQVYITQRNWTETTRWPSSSAGVAALRRSRHDGCNGRPPPLRDAVCVAGNSTPRVARTCSLLRHILRLQRPSPCFCQFHSVPFFYFVTFVHVLHRRIVTRASISRRRKGSHSLSSEVVTPQITAAFTRSLPLSCHTTRFKFLKSRESQTRVTLRQAGGDGVTDDGCAVNVMTYSP